MDNCPCCGVLAPVRCNNPAKGSMSNIFVCWECLVYWLPDSRVPQRYTDSALAGVGLHS